MKLFGIDHTNKLCPGCASVANKIRRETLMPMNALLSGGSVNAAEAIQRQWDQLSADADKAAAHHKATCTKGCAWCCYLLALSTLADGVLIAHELLKKPDWPALLPKLREGVLATLGPDGRAMEVGAFFKLQVPCPFLDLQSRTCTVYAQRPVVCRSHVVVTDPTLCAPAEPTPQIGALDLRQLDSVAYDVTIQLAGKPVAGPISLMVLLGLETWLSQRKAWKWLKLVQRETAALPSAEQWIEGWHEWDKGLDRIREERGLPTPHRV